MKGRRLRTRVGDLSLEVPQVRGCSPYEPSVFGKWQRSERALLVACGEMYLNGVSTRQVGDVLSAMCDSQVSAMTVSRVAFELDEQLKAFRERRLEDRVFKYLKIDARYEKVRVDRQVVSQAVLVVCGITAEGRREMLDWFVGDSESESTWGELFRRLKDRGLRGLQMIVSDAHSGIRAAIRRHFQGVSWQRCVVHFKREAGMRVGSKQKQLVQNELRVVFAGEDKAECVRRGEEMAQRWEKRYPVLSRMLREGLEDCLTVHELVAGTHRRLMNSTNLLENVMRQLKKRTRVVGVFPNRASCDRLVGALLVEIHEGWAASEATCFQGGLSEMS